MYCPSLAEKGTGTNPLAPPCSHPQGTVPETAEFIVGDTTFAAAVSVCFAARRLNSRFREGERKRGCLRREEGRRGLMHVRCRRSEVQKLILTFQLEGEEVLCSRSRARPCSHMGRNNEANPREKPEDQGFKNKRFYTWKKYRRKIRTGHSLGIGRSGRVA